MILKGRLAELMVQVAPNLYRKYITTDRKGKAILYVKMQKAIYGLLRSALLLYRKLVAELESTGFVINLYDPCVANKVINGEQITVCWHVDDLKVSHMEPAEVTKFGDWLSKPSGVSVATHCGKVHDYLDGEHDRVHQDHHQRFARGDNCDTSKSCRRPSVHSEEDRGDAAAGGTSTCVPSHNSTGAVSEC
jgi:hypothetical protein